MQVFTVALLAALATVGYAAPAMSPKPASPLEKRGGINDCGNSSFENQTSGGSPTVSDCQKLASQVSGTYTPSCGGVETIASYGSCNFDVQAYGCGGDIYDIGDQDIIDLINSSISMYGGGGLVGSTGTMSCQAIAPGGSVSVTWGIY